jgi:hypothetical protein
VWVHESGAPDRAKRRVLAGTELGSKSIGVTVDNGAPPLPPPPPPPCNVAEEPTPIAGQGYSVRFADCFDTLNRTTWCNRQWYQPAPPVGVQFVQDGVLHLLRRRADSFANTNVSTEPCGQANAKSFIQGYFEARMRWPGVQGAAAAFWMLSTVHATNPNWPQPACPNPNCLSAELDVFEGYGHYPKVFTGTLHRNTRGFYGVPDSFNSNNWQPQPFRLADSWHTYAALWTATEVRWYVDGQLTHSWPVWDSTNQRMHLILSHGNTPWMPENAVNSSTPDVLDFEVDWVRVWQRSPRLSLGGKRTQRAGKMITVIVKAASENLWATASGKTSIGGSRKAYPLRSARAKFIARRQQATLKVKLPTKALVAIRRALRRHRTVSVKLTIKARDAVGNTTVNRRTIKLGT